jgi:hypothetical protein
MVKYYSPITLIIDDENQTVTVKINEKVLAVGNFGNPK